MTSMVKIIMDVVLYNEGGYDPDDSWSRDSYSGTARATEAILVSEDGVDVLYYDGSLKVGDIVHVVYAEYTTGDSFGIDGGNYELLSIHTDYEEARESAAHYENVNDYSVPWNGYFETLDGIRMDTFVLQGENE